MLSRQLSALCLALGLASAASSADILFNQVGYYPELPKRFAAADTDATSFELIDAANGQAVLSGDLDDAERYADAGVTVKQGDFSGWSQPGSYAIRLNDGTTSAPFRIDERALAAPLRAALKSFYFNRSSAALPPEFAGDYARAAGHPDTDVRYHSSTGHADGSAASPKGWYDAGDYGKYVVNGGYALGTLLSLYELHPQVFGDDTGIPESGNGLSDLLDECRWEIDWFLTMQDTDGGVFHKVTTLGFAGFVMPDQATAQRYFIGKSTAATLNFAAAMAQTARVFRAIDPELAETCQSAAESAWAWAVAQPDARFRNPSDVYTGEYGDPKVSDEFLWAAAQLYVNGRTELVASTLEPALQSPELDATATWGGTRNLGYYTLATVDSALPDGVRQKIVSALLAKADAMVASAAKSPIGVPVDAADLHWGSNGYVAAKGVLLAYAYRLSGNHSYLLTMQDIADYLLGRNATTYSFLTGAGSRSPLHIHHRPSGADGVAAPVPGFLVGGPNVGRQDKLDYPHTEPARAYFDHEGSYASNEIAINWNAPFVFLLGSLEAEVTESDAIEK